MRGSRDVNTKETKEVKKLRKTIARLEEHLTALEEKEQKIDDLYLINSLNIAVNRGEELKKVLNILARETKKLFHCHGASVYILSHDKKYLILQQNPQITAIFRLLPEVVVRRIPSDIKIHLTSRSLYNKMLSARKPQLTNDAATIKKMISEFTDSKMLKKLVPKIFKYIGSRSVISIPLVATDEVIGMMDVSRATPFTSLELKRFEVIAKELTIILSNYRTHAALKKSRDLIEKFMNAATSGFLLFDEDLNVIAINNYIIKKFNIDEKNAIGTNIADASMASWESGRFELYKKVLKTGKPLQFADIMAPEKYGGLHLNVKAFKVGNGLGMILDDITEQRKTEEKLRLATEKMQYLVASTSAVIYTAKPEPDYGATFVSDNITELFGYEPKQFIGQSDFWIQHVHPGDSQRAFLEINKLLDKKLHTYKYRFRCKDGQYVWVKDKMKLLFDEDGKPIEIIGYLTILEN